MKIFIRICMLIALFILTSMMTTEKQILTTILMGVVCIYWDIADKE